MKQLLLLLSMLSLYLFSFSQSLDTTLFEQLAKQIVIHDTTKGTVIRRADGRLDYLPTVISGPSYDTLFKPIFGKVMLGNSDLVNQGSAYALSVDQFSSTFSINYNWAKNKSAAKDGYYNLGFAASSSSKLLPVFSKNQWQQGLGLSFGFTKRLNSHIAFRFDDSDFFSKRQQLIVSRLKESYILLNLDTDNLKAQIAAVDSIKFTPAGLPSIKQKIKNLNIVSTGDLALKQNQLSTIEHLKNIIPDSLKLSLYVDSIISDFETKYFKNINYGFWWYNVLVKPEYKGISIYDTTAAKAIGIQKKDYFRLSLEGYINHAHSGHNLFLFQVGTALKNTNYLEGKKSTDITFLQPSSTPDTSITNLKEVILADDYDQYKKQFILVNPIAGFDWFFGTKRLVGWELFYSSKFGFKQKRIPFDNLFTFRTGLLLSANGKTDLSKSTFALLAQWEDLKYKNFSIKDNFSFSVRIGIPFNN